MPRRPFVLLAVLAGLGSPPLLAQEDGRQQLDAALARLLTQDDRTVLAFSEQARREVPQDELDAVLVAHAEAATAAAAQTTVNRMMAAALETARKVPGVREQSGGYTVSQQTRENEPATWVAEQQLNLTAGDGPGLLGLVGELQGGGLAIQDLRWTLAANTRRGIERQLLGEALDALNRTARTAADGLSLRLAGWRRVTIEPNRPVEPYRSMAMMAAKSAEAAPPVAAAGTNEVVVSVSAEALLAARQR